MKRYGLLLLALALPCAASEPLGWRWYNEPTAVKRAPTPPPPTVNTLTRTLSATEQMRWFHQYHEEAIAAAAIDPTNAEKTEQMMRLNHFLYEQSSQLGMTAKQVLHTHPELDYTKDHPVQGAARPLYLEQRKAKQEQSLEQLIREGWGVFYVYEGHDALSQQLGTSLAQFAQRYDFSVLGVSKDGMFIDAIANNRVDDGRVEVPYTPAIVLVNPHTAVMKPLSYGYIAHDRLLGRFHNVATDYRDLDF